jgi:hypothetical protein
VSIGLLLGSFAVLAVETATANDKDGGVVIADPSDAPDCITPTNTSPPQTIVGDWNCTALVEVRASKAFRNGPTVVARALAIVQTCVYDAWAAYDAVAVGTRLGGTLRRPAVERTDTNKAIAISFAAHRCLRNLYPEGLAADPPGSSPRVRLDAALATALATYAYNVLDPQHVAAAAVGTAASQAVIDFRANDGANQYGNAPCPAGNVCPTVPITIYSTPPCVPYMAPLNQLGGVSAPLAPLPCLGQGGAPTGPYADYDDAVSSYTHYVPSNPIMGYCTPPFAPPLLAVCPAADPFLSPLLPWPNVVDPNSWQPLIFVNHARQTFLTAHFGRVTPFALTSASQFDASIPPPDYLKNHGHYQKNVNELIKHSRDLDEERKLIVEYWADGPDSELPPGHWSIFAQFVSRRDGHTIDQDAKMFFAMQNASLDAGIVGWHAKRKYNGVRPITAIRHDKQGQTIRAWGGPGRPIENFPGERWMPYNPGTNLTPPFPGYFSGHSVYSRSSATVLKLFTGSDDFGFSTLIPACDPAFFGIDFFKCFGRVEPGVPSVDTIISFATFDDAANQAGFSRFYGGIHFIDDNTTGQAVGVLIGQQAWTKAQTYFDGTAAL